MTTVLERPGGGPAESTTEPLWLDEDYGPFVGMDSHSLLGLPPVDLPPAIQVPTAPAPEHDGLRYELMKLLLVLAWRWQRVGS
jgi:hypothetical protein